MYDNLKKEMEYMAALTKENIEKSFAAMENEANNYTAEITEKEGVIDFTNHALTKFLVKLSALVDSSDEKKIGAYFHVLNDLERIGDHAENFYQIGMQMQESGLAFSQAAQEEIAEMKKVVLAMFEIAKEAFEQGNSTRLDELTALENRADNLKKELSASHYARLAEGNCKVELSPYFTSTVAGLERVADHLVNVGYSVLNPTGSQSEALKEAQA